MSDKYFTKIKEFDLRIIYFIFLNNNIKLQNKLFYWLFTYSKDILRVNSLKMKTKCIPLMG